jgi:outer membrane scaffolding protein for murein synthesis (MipA/OmpV family)
MAGIFINAAQARERARLTSVVHLEVTALEQAVLATVQTGGLNVTVSSGTTMTTSNVYYKAYYGVSNDTVSSDQVNYIKTYFENLSYGVTISENSQTGDTLVWDISW